MTPSVITATRRGFAYQDKYALLRLLQIISSGEIIIGFAVDKPFGANRSLDIEIIFENKKEIYEVKTGSTFQETPAEFWKELLTLREFDVNDEYTKIIVVDPDLRIEFKNIDNDVWLIANHNINKQNSSGERMDGVAQRCLVAIGEDNFNDVNDFISFIQKVKIKVGPKSDKDHDNDRLSDLDDKICSEIQNMAEKLGITSANWAIPDYSVALELLERVRLGSEGRANIYEEVIDSLVAIFSRRQRISRTTSDSERIETENELKKKFTELYNLKFESEAENPMETPEGSSVLT